MKNYKNIFVMIVMGILGTALSSCNSQEEKPVADEKFVIVRLEHEYFVEEGGDEENLLELCINTAASAGDYFSPDKTQTANRFSRAECSEKVDEAINAANVKYSSAAFMTEGKSIVKDTYTIYASGYGDNAHNYFCIPAKMWDDIDLSPDEITEGRKVEVFIQAMKKCGLTDFNWKHINLAETPFICDRYSETDLVPHKELDELIEGIQEMRDQVSDKLYQWR